jgi:hypothetical protein
MTDTNSSGEITSDLDTNLEELDEESNGSDQDDVTDLEVPAKRRKVFTDKSDPPLDALYDRSMSGDLVLQPLFQRRQVWDDNRASRLIESLIIEVPLPVFYFAEGPDGTSEVIDGQQRLTAVFRFLKNDFALRKLRALPELNGKRFKDLDKSTQKLVKNSSVRTITFRKESDDGLRFEIFERLNTGAVPLNRQELRNCVYHGPYNQLLMRLSEDPDYRALMGLHGPERRMRDVEYVLRFAAFYHSTYLKYKPPMDRFLDEDMRKHRNIADRDAAQLEAAFKTSLTLTRSMLGTHAFRRFYRGTEQSPGGRWEQKKFNASLYDVVMGCFADQDKNRVMANLDSIREAFIALMTDNEEFINAIELSTSSDRMVRQRFDLWRRTLDDILSQSATQPRTYTRDFKAKLYTANPTCALCQQHIAELDDAAVDHIAQYWTGGKTIPENARLTHRYCNMARPRNDI